MNSKIMQQICGKPRGGYFQADPNEIDAGNTHIETHLASLQYSNGVSVKSDDIIVNGYTNQGLPFQIVAHQLVGESELTYSLIVNHIVPEMYDLAQELSKHGRNDSNYEDVQDSRKIITSFIKKIVELRAKHANSVEFTMSLVVTYEFSDSTYCAGFSVGNLGIVLRDKETMQQLAYGTLISTENELWTQDRFCSPKEGAPDLNAVIARNNIFRKEVFDENEICSYTVLSEKCLQKITPNDVDSPDINNDQLIKLRNICDVQSINLIRFEVSSTLEICKKKLCTLLNDTNSQALRDEIQSADIDTHSKLLSVDMSFGSIIIPERELMRRLSKMIMLNDASIKYACTCEDIKKNVNELRPLLINMIASAQLRVKLPRKHSYKLSRIGITIFCHSERADYLLKAFLDAPTLLACLQIIDHQLAFYDPACEKPRALLPGWLDPNIRDRLEASFSRHAHKGVRGLHSLLLLLKTKINTKLEELTPPNDVTVSDANYLLPHHTQEV